MDNKFLDSIGIDSNGELNAILEQLEERQLEYFERLENVSDKEREKELKAALERIENETTLIKKEIASINTSLIFESGDEGGTQVITGQQNIKNKGKGSGRGSQKEQGKDGDSSGKKNDDQVKKEIEALKQQKKDEDARKEQQRKEQQKKAQEQSDQTQSAGQQAGTKKNHTESGSQQQTGSQQSQQPVGNNISAGLQSYQKKDYRTAFKIFSELSEKRDAAAQFMLARMYEEGEGTNKDADRARFWYKSSADLGNADSQYAYAVLILGASSGMEDSEEVKSGMSYMEKSADQGYQAAMDRYIEIVLKGTMDSHRISRAIYYCDVRSGQMKDSYERDKYLKKKKALQEQRKKEVKQKNAQKIPTRISIVGNILYIIGFLYLFRGIHPEFWGGIKFLAFLPAAKAGWIVPWDTFTTWAESFLTTEGVFGVEVLTAAACLSSIGATVNRRKSAQKFGTFTRYVFVAMIGWHIWVCVTKEPALSDEDVFLALIVPMIIGVIVGKLVKSIFKMNEPANPD